MWFDNLINVHSAVQGIVILSLICTLGLALGKLHVKGISLGIQHFAGSLMGSREERTYVWINCFKSIVSDIGYLD